MPHQLHTTMPQKKHLMFPVYKYVNEFCLVRFELVAKNDTTIQGNYVKIS